MEGTIQINNYGTCKEISKKELCSLLLRKGLRYYKGYPRMFDTETDLLISKLHETVSIQIYKTGVVRLFFEQGHFEESCAVYLRELPKEILEVLGNM